MDLKPLSKDAVPRALEKAERYRLLNEPSEAESICKDVLAVDAGNQAAIVTLLLALTDQFEHRFSDAVTEARALLPALADEYSRAYYGGIIEERRAKAQLRRSGPGVGPVVYESLSAAMALFETAAARRPPGNDDAILRWNACVRIIQRNPYVRPETREGAELPLE